MANAPTGNLTRTDGSPLRILVVDDKQMLADLLVSALRYGGWRVTTAGIRIVAVRSARKIDPGVIVLDIMLPGSDDLEVMRRMRGHRPDMPVLFLAAKDAIENHVAGLAAGGDDYVTKPFSLEETVVRLRALLCRSGASGGKPASILEVGDLRMDGDSREVWRGGDKIQLTATEFELLRYFMRNSRRVLSRPQILDRVWNYDLGGQASIVELYISYLRRKIDKGRRPMIHTMRGVGHTLRPAAGTDERG